ncbi:MAG TPA: hypothetical protein VJB12_05535 [Candidatus Nanoarchaeia archaeon]|nr:hypothetical protein [Candidatus Nanoarchaeia archaeon]
MIRTVVKTARVRKAGFGLIKPIYFSIATNYESELRVSGHPHYIHHVNSMIRDEVWDLPYKNTIGCRIILAGHDNGEDHGKNTLSGAMAINRWFGSVFGRGYEDAANLMTNNYSIIINNLRRQGKRTKDAVDKDEISQITIDEIIKDFSDLKPSFREGSSRKTGLYLDDVQNTVLDEMKGRIKKFSYGVSHSKYLSDQDKTQLKTMTRDWYRKILQNRKNPIDQDEVESRAKNYLGRIEKGLEEIATAPVRAQEEGITERVFSFDKGRSEAYHKVRKLAYRLYLEDIETAIMEKDWAGYPFSPFDILSAKLADRADNTRFPKDSTLIGISLNFEKTVMLLDMAERCLNKYGGRKRDPSYLNAKGNFEFLKSQLVLSITSNYGFAQLISDTNLKENREFISSQFDFVYAKFGDAWMNGFKNKIQNKPWLIGTDRATANDNFIFYQRLEEKRAA